MDRLSLSRGLQKSGAAVMGLTEDSIKEWNAKYKSSTVDNQDEDAISDYSFAKSALSDTKLGSVHSTSSISAIKRRMDKIKETPDISTYTYKEPTISIVDDGRLNYKQHVNQLPYMNRNPAV